VADETDGGGGLLARAQFGAKRSHDAGTWLVAMQAEPDAQPESAGTTEPGHALQLALLDTLFAAAPLGIGLWDGQGRYVRVNERLAAMHGIPAEAHIGRTIGEVAGELGASVEAAIRGVIDTGVPIYDREVTGELPTRPGEERHWRGVVGCRCARATRS
jgi:PAS domain S-box-containing protein